MFPQNALDLAETDPQLQALMPLPEILPSNSLDKSPFYQEVIEAVMQAYAERPALGCRDYRIEQDPYTGQNCRVLLPQFSTISYRALNRRIKQLATTWRDHAQHRVSPGDFFCIVGSAGIDYATIDLACAYAQAVSVPLQATLGGDLDGIFANTGPTTVAAAIDDLVMTAEMAVAHPSIRSIIAFDYDSNVDGERKRFEATQAMMAGSGSRAELVSLDALLELGSAEAWHPLPPAPEGLERIALLVHSSGSTGQPKGVIFTERLALNIWGTGPIAPVIRVAYAPMNHMMGRSMVYSTLARGGTAFFTAKPDLSELFEDIRLVRPTELAMLPRLLEMIHRHFQGEVARRGVGNDRDAKIEAQVMGEMRANFLGDRICALSCASAPTTPDVSKFITDCFQVPLNDSYGMTEAGAILINGRIARPPVIDYKLRDVPELGYFASDKPYPRGELCVKTETPTPGYFKQPDVTARLFDKDGYLQTGDIMEERAPDHLEYLERANDVLKLSQGEFVPIGTLGGTFETYCPTIHQIYIYGNSTRSFLLAVVVPDIDVIRTHLGSQPDGSELRTLIRTEMKEAATTGNMRAVDVPREFIIELEPFSFENGLLTSVHKRRRPALKARYGEQLEQLYVTLEIRQAEDMRALHKDNGMSAQQKVVKALEASLGIEDATGSVLLNFSELGGDSLGAVSFATLLSEIFGVEVSINTVLSPAGNVETWTRSIEMALLDHTDGRPTFARIHGEGATELHAKDLDVAAFIDAEALDNCPLDPPIQAARCVLLTGATGYLGRFLCLEWLERMEARNGRLVCLIRASDESSAMQRLSAGFDTDPALAKKFAALAEKHLEVLVGDVAEPSLGLAAPLFDSLAREVDHIVHCGALVNHVLPYEELFGPNVVGTAELLRLALTHHQKGIDYISSLAVVTFLEPGQGWTETTPLLQDVALTNAHTRGYSTSKWAGEQLLHSANRQFGLPVNIFRCDMILADRRYDGQINVPDSFTRLLYSLVLTETAPESFYELAHDDTRQSAHYDGLPADFVAAAIVGIGDTSAQPAVLTYHVVNPHTNDGISTDTFVDWIEDAGYQIERESDYSRWLERFEAKLRALPEEKRQRSALPILAAYKAPMKIAASDSIDSTAFVEAVRSLPARHVPQLDRALLLKYLRDLRLLGLISEPLSQTV